MKRIVVLTSGGDAPGMNAAIRAVVRSALYHDIEVFASIGGYRGLVEKQLEPMTYSSVANSIQYGGTIIKAERSEAFYKKETRDECRAYLNERGIDGLVVIGGDGSFRGAAKLYEEGGPKVIGIPATIDNDIVGTDYAIGFDTARNTALDAIDRIRDTASSHNRDFIIEVMGRNAGFIAVDVGIAGGAEYILIPEIPFNVEQLAERLRQQSRTKQSTIIVVAEGDQPGRSVEIAETLGKLNDRTYRICILGHTQRGGRPSALDRKIASMMGAAAVDALRANETNKMVALINDHIQLTTFPDVNQPAKRFDNKALVNMNEIICQ